MRVGVWVGGLTKIALPDRLQEVLPVKLQQVGGGWGFGRGGGWLVRKQWAHFVSRGNADVSV